MLKTSFLQPEGPVFDIIPLMAVHGKNINDNVQPTAALSPEKAEEIKTKIAAVARKNGYQVYAVGGYVRDLLLGRTPKDIDVVAIKKEAGVNSGIDLARLVAKEYGFHPPVEYPRFAVAVVNIDGEHVDFVAPRTEFYTPDSRKPDVELGTLQEDAIRRDFTVNALYQDLSTGEIADPTGYGQKDLKDKMIRVTDHQNPDVIFSDDPLRALRAIRQSYALNFAIEEKTREAIKRNAARLSVISRERIQDEFCKILTGPKAGEAIRLLHDIGLTRQFLPEFDATVGVTQDSKYHHELVDEHILAAVDLVPDDIPSRLTALLHDIAKPAKRTEETGVAHFYEHELAGADMAEAILTRLRFPNEVINEVVFRIRNHMWPMNYRRDWSPKTVRKFMKELGDYLNKVLDFAEVDIRASRREEGLETASLEDIRHLRERIKEQEAQGNKDLHKAKPLLDGNELQKLFNKGPGPWISEIHKYLADQQLETPSLTKEEAIAKAKEYMETKDD